MDTDFTIGILNKATPVAGTATHRYPKTNLNFSDQNNSMVI